MYRSILVPLDGSQHSEHAIPWAITIAEAGSSLYLTHIHTPPAPVIMEGVVVADPGSDDLARTHETHYLTKTVDAVKAVNPQIHVELLKLDGDSALPAALAKASTNLKTELIVMTTHGRGPFSRFLLGSIADDTFRASPVPVLIVRGANLPSNVFGRPGVTEVLVPLDGSPTSETIVVPATKLAKRFRANITLFMVTDAVSHEATANAISTTADTRSTNPSSVAKQAELYLERLAKQIGEQGVTATVKLVHGGDPAMLILRHASAHPGIVTALSTHGRTGISRLFAGSVASSVVHDATGPVLVFRPQEPVRG